jgi:hypothetical protein
MTLPIRAPMLATENRLAEYPALVAMFDEPRPSPLAEPVWPGNRSPSIARRAGTTTGIPLVTARFRYVSRSTAGKVGQ